MERESTAREDEQLLAAVAGRSEDALRALYVRYGGLVFSLALRITGDPLTAQEVVQDVFLRCWERAAEFDPAKGAVHAWLMGIARNRSIDVLRGGQHRSRQRDRELLPGDDDRHSRAMPGEADAIVLQLSLADALDCLTPGQREAIDLVLAAGLTQSEIARELGVPLGTVKTRIRDGMARLRVILEGGERVGR
ncbi:MAG: sigma-70 family RNA polymerase sigma factor [Chloroflexi bacterium]|nr:sigma-70 family RNA polymerase sigma factor [Chloroflexota bacterium]